MRSTLVHLATKQVPSRFELVALASKVTRRFHKPSTCIGTTINEALERIAAQESLGSRRAWASYPTS